MSSDRPPEFFLDRSLGKTPAQRLRQAGHVVHLIADFYPGDATEIPDPVWIAEGCARGWILLTKDRKIRYRTEELAALDGHLFCLADGNLTREAMADRFLLAMPAIRRAVSHHSEGFWHVHNDGRITRMWP
jgi:hypothetical protein